ncbi:MAG: hypothetical protein M1827_004967 [Pycnora praestabilis]|nr:MAG: hypothetical protein M1827_004967 [Pycnora praestabilis]
MAQSSRPMESRTGRNKQRYGSQGERLVAGVVPLSFDRTKVLVIQSTRKNGWVLPKGGWETDENTAQEAACREAWEEAGVICRIQRDLGSIYEAVTPEQIPTQASKNLYQFFEVSVDTEEAQWPEMYKRARQWMTYAEAAQVLAGRPELYEALNRSSIIR